MRTSSFLGLLGLAGLCHGTHDAHVRRTPRNYDKNDYYLVHLDEATKPQEISQRLGLEYEGQVGVLDHLHVFAGPKSDSDFVRDALKERKLRRRSESGSDILDGVLYAKRDAPRKPWSKRVIPQPPPGFEAKTKMSARIDKPNQFAVQRQNDVMSTLDISDPIFAEQWHLINTVQVGHDINVTGAWLQGYTGEGTIVAMVDDGIDMDSEDLRTNYYAEGSWDFNDHGPEPRPRLSDDHHGTRCAGEIAAVRNNVCGIGVAYDGKISGLRILSKIISDEDEAVAMTYDYQHNQIYSCSWGPPDDGRSMEAPGIPIRQAMLKGVQDGRGGLGSIYVFASGNGAGNDDNCNFDGYTNSIYSITVGAVDRAGKHPYYSEKCSAQLVVTYSSGSGDAIHTTDVGTNKCYTGHGGTSAAAPLAAGIFALVLQARPDLTWRDMQYIVMNSAVPVGLDGDGEDPGDWVPTASGRKFSHTFGYGKVDTYAAIELAKSWTKVKPQAWYFSPWIHVEKEIPQGKDGLSVSFEVTADMLKEANLERVEHVTVTMNVNHTRRGDLSADLISPENVISHIATTRKLDSAAKGYDDWTFMSVVHWGESGVGKWTVVVKDSKQNDHTGTWIDWHLKLWGEAIDADKATKLPMPHEDDDNDHAKLATTTIAATTTSIAHPTDTDVPVANPTDHIDRPEKVRPSTSGGASPTETETPGGAGESQAADSSSSNWISWLPSFGVSTGAQMWIYGALALIIIFCCGLGIYFWMARRRRLRNNPRSDYEFELLHEEEAEGLESGEKGALAGRKGRRTRGGELYDAFAGGSDDEDDFDGSYRDRSADRRPLDSDEEETQHVIGHDDDDDDEDDDDEKQERRLLGGSAR